LKKVYLTGWLAVGCAGQIGQALDMVFTFWIRGRSLSPGTLPKSPELP